MSSTDSNSTVVTEGQSSQEQQEMDELQVLKSLHASMKALQQMVIVMNKDIITMAKNMEELAVVNLRWQKLFEEHKKIVDQH